MLYFANSESRFLISLACLGAESAAYFVYELGFIKFEGIIDYENWGLRSFSRELQRLRELESQSARKRKRVRLKNFLIKSISKGLRKFEKVRLSNLFSIGIRWSSS